MSGAWTATSTTVCEALGESTSSETSSQVVFATTNGGSTWSTQNLPQNTGYVDDIVCPSTSVCEASSGDDDGAVAVGTTDGGSTWTAQTLPPGTSSVADVACPSPTNCLATGAGAWPTGSEILSLTEPTPAAGGLTPLTPARILDTRNGTGGISGPVASDHSISLNVEGVGGVPASGVSAVVLNVTATAPSANGHLTVYPDGASVPSTSNLNFSAGETCPTW